MDPVIECEKVAATPSISIDELRQLTKKIMENPVAGLQDLEADKLAEVKKYINPLGTITSGKKSCAVASIFNMNEAYRKKLIVTGLISYIHRLVYEYEPERELAKLDAWQKAAPADVRLSDADHSERRAKIIEVTRGILGDFMGRHFVFDPDHHVRKAHKLSAIKPDIADCLKTATELEAKLQAKPENLYRFMRNNILYARTCTESAAKILNEINLTIIDPSIPIEDKSSLLIRLQIRLTKINDELGRIAEPLAKADTSAAWHLEPPRDVFYHFDRYMHNHYEELREMTDAVYTERADIDDIIILYDTFSGPNRIENANNFMTQHEGDFKQDPIIIENDGITLLGPFKQNRDKINYLTKNTQLLKEMNDQKEVDDKLGKDIIDKKMKDGKKKDIEMYGPDDIGLKEYRKAMSTIETLGAKRGMTQKEQEEYAAAIVKKEDAEVPDGAIQTDVFFTDSEGQLRKQKLYTQAEKPLHLIKGSPFVGQYQPKREDGDD